MDCRASLAMTGVLLAMTEVPLAMTEGLEDSVRARCPHQPCAGGVQPVAPCVRGVAQAQGDVAVLSQVLPAPVSRRADGAGGDWRLAALWLGCCLFNRAARVR